MTATSHHGFHPDAESLSAFSERALGKRERAEVLAHLAVCGRCREVVALASEAAEADEVTAAARPRKVIAPNAWWKQWRLVWVPTAVVATVAAVSVAVYIERADRRAANIKIAEQNPAPSTTPPPASAPTEQAKIEPPAAAAPAPAAHPAKHAHSGQEEPRPAPTQPVVAAQTPSESEAPEPARMNQAEAYRETRPPSHAEATPAPPDLTASTMHPTDSQPGAGDGEKKQAEPQRQAEADRSQMRNFKARTAPFATHGTNAAPPAGATQTVTVTAVPRLETQPAASAEPAPMFGIKSSREVNPPAKPIRLPSGVTAVSVASDRHFLLAIDEAGVLFLSENRGVTWERVNKQWMGRAVTVRRQSRDHDASQAAPNAQNGTASDGTAGSSSADSGDAPSLIEFFELSNDENQTWVSTDGRTWTPK